MTLEKKISLLTLALLAVPALACVYWDWREKNHQSK